MRGGGHEAVTLGYGGDLRRLRRTVGASTELYPLPDVEYQVPTTGQGELRKHVRFAGRLLATSYAAWTAPAVTPPAQGSAAPAAAFRPLPPWAAPLLYLLLAAPLLAWPWYSQR